jgi:hypothetical protein
LTLVECQADCTISVAGNFFYTVPWEDRHQVHHVATVEEVKRQWRKRLFDAHPDQGGDSEEFKRVFAEYERAIAMAI